MFGLSTFFYLASRAGGERRASCSRSSIYVLEDILVFPFRLHQGLPLLGTVATLATESHTSQNERFFKCGQQQQRQKCGPRTLVVMLFKPRRSLELGGGGGYNPAQVHKPKVPGTEDDLCVFCVVSFRGMWSHLLYGS